MAFVGGFREREVGGIGDGISRAAGCWSRGVWRGGRVSLLGRGDAIKLDGTRSANVKASRTN